MYPQREARLRRRRGFQWLLVQSVLEDGFNVLIGVGLEGQSSGTGSLQTFGGIAFF
jgi:hypothetical protein